MINLQKITSTVEMKDSSSDAVQIVYYSSCLGGKELVQTNKCEGLKVNKLLHVKMHSNYRKLCVICFRGFAIPIFAKHATLITFITRKV